MDARWRIELLGGLRAEGCGRVLTRFRTRKTEALLACLASHLPRPVARAELIERFWPDAQPDRARQSLSQSLSSLRCQLEPPGVPTGAVLMLDRHFARLNPAAASTDVRAFEDALRRARCTARPAERLARLTGAVDLYRGPFLAGYEETWILPERERLAEAFFQALLQLVSLLEEGGDLPGAIQTARRGVATDPLREEAHRALIRLLVATGDRVGARRQYRELERLLAEEFGGLPDPATRDLVAALSSGAPAAPPRSGPPPRDIAHPAPHRDLASGTSDERLPTGTGRPGERIDLAEPVEPDAPQNLPLQFTRFFGREEEIARLCALLQSSDGEAGRSTLVTLTGPGGSGKTRLALAVAERLGGAYGGAIWFVPLAELADADRIPGAIVTALGVPRAPGVEPIDQAIHFLSRRPCVLVLDNYEHLVDEGASLVQTLRQRLPDLTCLVTSRRRLDLTGEREFPVPPLPTPDRVPIEAGADLPLTLSQYASVQLFVDRAQAVRPDFQLTKRNAASIGMLCSGLEGIPLALELAAARVSVLTPSRMVEQLERRLEFLTSRLRDGTARHRTLRGAIDWSYRLLCPGLQRFFARLSVFRGGCTAEAAGVVCQEQQALDRLEELRACSLIVAEEADGGEMRFRMLETLREYAQEQLPVEEATALRQRHAGVYLELAEAAAAQLQRPQQMEWFERLEAEHDNLRAALAAKRAEGDGETEVRMLAALWVFWLMRGYWHEARRWLEPALEETLETAARLAREREPSASAYLCARSLALGRAAVLAAMQGDYVAARPFCEEALVMGEASGDPAAVAEALYTAAYLAQSLGEPERARVLGERVLAMRRDLDDLLAVAGTYSLLGTIARRQGEPEKARAYFEQSLAIKRAEFGPRGIAWSLHNLGEVSEDLGDYSLARSYYQESLALNRQVSEPRGIVECLEGLARVAGAEGEPEKAARLFGAAAALRDAIGSIRNPVERDLHERAVAAVRAAAGEAAFERAWASGRASTREQAVAEALGPVRVL
jgi:predicted ATPase